MRKPFINACGSAVLLVAVSCGLATAASEKWVTVERDRSQGDEIEVLHDEAAIQTFGHLRRATFKIVIHGPGSTGMKAPNTYHFYDCGAQKVSTPVPEWALERVTIQDLGKLKMIPYASYRQMPGHAPARSEVVDRVCGAALKP